MKTVYIDYNSLSPAFMHSTSIVAAAVPAAWLPLTASLARRAAADNPAAAASSPYAEALAKRGLEVLYLTEPIDEVAMLNLQASMRTWARWLPGQHCPRQ
jgi:hypothetical protein